MSDFRDIFQKSIYSPAFYAEIPNKPLSFSLKYFFSLALLGSFILAALFATSVAPRINGFLASAGDKILDHYPAELQVIVKDHEIFTNVKEPYFIPFPQELKSAEGDVEPQPQDNLLVIDTTRPFSIEQFREYHTNALLTKDNIVYLERDGKIEIAPLTGIPNVTITKEWIASHIRQFEPFLKFIAPILVLAIFFVLMAAFSFKLVYLFFGALLVLLIARIKNITLGYKVAYRISIHALTWSFIATFFLMIFSPDYSPPMLTTILLAVSAWVNLKTEAFSAPVAETPIAPPIAGSV